jgi:hypothetical protein
MGLYDPQKHRPHVSLVGADRGVAGLSFSRGVLWSLGYPDRAMRSSQEALALAQRLSHPYTCVYTLDFAARLRLLRREAQPALNLAEVEMTHARAWVCEVAGRWNSPAGLGLDPAGRGRGRPHAASPSRGHLTGARGKLAAGRGVCHAGRGIGERRTHRRGTGHTDRSSGESAQKRGVPLRSRVVSTQRGVASPGWQEPRGTG